MKRMKPTVRLLLCALACVVATPSLSAAADQMRRYELERAEQGLSARIAQRCATRRLASNRCSCAFVRSR